MSELKLARMPLAEQTYSPGLTESLPLDNKLKQPSPEVDLSKLCLELYQSSPDKLKGVSFERFNKMSVDIFNALDSSLSQDAKLDLMRALLTQTVPSGRMGVNNYNPGTDPNGELTITQTHKGKSVLENLHKIATSNLHKSLTRQGFEKSDFLTSLIQEMTDRSINDQGDKATCASTCAQWHQIAENPALLVSQVKELLTQGVSTNSKGDPVLRLTDIIPVDKRTAISSLIQSCMMNAVDDGYCPTSDIISGKLGRHPGLYSRQLWELQSKFSEKPQRVAYLGDQDYRAIIDSALDERRCMIAVVEGLGTGDHLWHDVNIIDRKDGYIYFRNPWPDEYIENKNGVEVLNQEAGICRMKEGRFLSQTQYIVYEADPRTTDLAYQPDGRDEIGGITAPVFTITSGSLDDRELLQRNLRRQNEENQKTQSSDKEQVMFDKNKTAEPERQLVSAADMQKKLREQHNHRLWIKKITAEKQNG